MDDFKRGGFIKLSALGFAGIALQLNSISSYAQMANANLGKWNDDTKLNWDAFLGALYPISKNPTPITVGPENIHRTRKAITSSMQFPRI